MRAPSEALRRRYPIGAEVLPGGGVHFRVWAPRCRHVEVVSPAGPATSHRDTIIELRPDEDGYFSGTASSLAADARYGFRLDVTDHLWPDPGSRFQPDGPEGLSQVVDPSKFHWSDAGWKGVGASGQVIYEMHIGTFTGEGTWKAAAEQIPELARAGMTLLEIMPVADFPGNFGWGYDGVCLFAPTRLYGPPDEFRRFVDLAHAHGVGVILDVVYNHFGTVANSAPNFSADYASKRYRNDWGDAINFDGPNSGPVREFFLTNARYWIEEFHLDGLRFDATQSIYDSSHDHILTALVRTARESAVERGLYVVAENEPQQTRIMRSAAAGGHGMDAAWNDDFHHAAHVRLSGSNEAYYSDFTGSVTELLEVLKRGFLYQGQWSQWQKQPRGTPTRGLPATAFVNFLENHDQIANSARGDRIDKVSSPGRLRAMTTLWLLAPQTPMFFQGQEFAASTPFLYFADNSGDQAKRVARGRAEFLKQFPTLATSEARSRLRDPADSRTFEDSRLNLTERETHAPLYKLHVDLLRLRREDPVFRSLRADQVDGQSLGPDCLLVRYSCDDGDDRLLLVNFGCDLDLSPVPLPLLAPPPERTWKLLFSSHNPAYGGIGTPPLETDRGWHLPGEATVVLATVPALPHPEESH